jgi:hypothetical protein
MCKNNTMKAAILSLLFSAFRSLIRVGLKRGLTIQDASQLLKAAFILEAKDEITKIGLTPNISKVAAMCGMHRREVTNLFDKTIDTKVTESNSLMSRIIGRWLGSRKYLTKDGEPKALILDGNSNSFSSLVKEVSQDLNCYTILFELERLKLVRRDKDTIILDKAGFEPKGDYDRELALLSSDIEQLINSVSRNIASEGTPENLHITTSYDNISPEHLPEIRKWIFVEGAAFHKKLRSFLSDYDRDLNPKLNKKNDKAVKVVVGSFSNSEEIEL